MKEVEYFIAGCAFDIAPVLTRIAFLSYSETGTVSIPECLPFKGEWGENSTASFLEDSSYPLPNGIHIIYLSIIEQKFYMLDARLPQEEIYREWKKKVRGDDTTLFEKIIVGMAPYGGVAVWLSGEKKQILVRWLQGISIMLSMEQFLPENPSIKLNDLCSFYIKNSVLSSKYLEQNGLPPRHLFDNYMKQFTYRYLPLFEHWDMDQKEWKKYEGEEDMKTMPELDYIEEALFDGTHDKLHDGGLMNYHQAGKPKKLSLKWQIKKSEYTAYFWFEDEEIRTVFERFYGVHPETKADFIIRIDSEKNKYELALYRYGLKEPQVISESAYQLLVFKNKFECYRSENYNQPRGAWIW